MEITVGNTSSVGVNGLNNITFSHINNASFLLVAFGRYGTGLVKSTGVTFDGDALTNILQVDGTNNTTVEFWHMTGAASKTANIVASFPTASDHWAGAVSLSGVNETDPIRGYENAAINTTGISDTIASAVNDLVIDAMTVSLGAVGVTADAGQTVLVEDVGQSSGISVTGGMSYEAGAASNTLGWSWGTNSDSAIALVSIKPIPAVRGAIIF